MKPKKKKILLQNRSYTRKNGKAWRVFLSQALIFGSFFVGALIIAILLGDVLIKKTYEYYKSDLPQAIIETGDYSKVTQIYDRSGKLLYEDVGEEERIYVDVEKVSTNFLKAILVSEDQYFFLHQGVDLWANLRAIWQNLRHDRVVGGASTITQQLARNFFLTKEISLARKIKEMILAQEIENNYSKKEILEFYLNKIPFGSNIYGIEAASRAFFNKSAQFLTLAEAAVLAPIPRSPAYLYPYTSEENKKRLFEKQQELLERMLKKGVITKQEYNKAIKQEINFNSRDREIFAPHFSFYVLDNLKKIYPDDIITSGLEVVTSLDLEFEEKIEKLLKKTIDEYRSLYKIDDGAIVVINAKNGNILAMAGSYDFWHSDYGQFNSATALRQPGSVLKPFLYSLAAENLGYSAKTILEDKPMSFNGYTPKNFSGYYRGEVSLENALLSSLNLPAVDTLDKLGLDKFFSALSGCRLELNREAGLSAAIGGASARLIDITAAYTVFVNQGACLSPNYLVRVKEGNGKTLIQNEPFFQKQVFSQQAAGEIDAILKKSLAHFSLTRKLAADPLLADTRVKTGTSNGPRDLWAIGYNSDIIVGVWLGNHDNTLLRSDVYGLQLAVPLWAEAMKLGKTHEFKEIIIQAE